MCAAIVLLTTAVNFLPLQQLLDAAAGLPWSAGLVAFLKINTQGLLILVGFSILLEFVGLERSKFEDRVRNAEVNSFLQAALRDESDEFLLKLSLERRLPEVNATQLIEGMHLDRGVMRDTRLTIRVLKDIKEGAQHPALVRLEHVTEFRWDLDSFLFCLVRTSAQLAAVTTRVDEVLETRVHVSSDVEFEDVGVRELTGELNPFSYILPTGQTMPLKLRRLSSIEARRLATKAGVSSTDIKFYRATGFSATRLRISNVQRISEETQNTWWVADRFIQITSISIDVSQVADPKSVELVMFLGSTHTSPALSPTGTWDTSDIGWILPGHGLSATWRRSGKN